jgi:hypothetical protein
MACRNRRDGPRCLESFFRMARPKRLPISVRSWSMTEARTEPAMATQRLPNVLLVRGAELYWCGGMRTAMEKAMLGEDDFRCD